MKGKKLTRAILSALKNSRSGLIFPEIMDAISDAEVFTTDGCLSVTLNKMKAIGYIVSPTKHKCDHCSASYLLWKITPDGLIWLHHRPSGDA